MNSYLSGPNAAKMAHTRGKNRFQAFPKRNLRSQADLKSVFRNQMHREGSVDSGKAIPIDPELMRNNQFLDKIQGMKAILPELKPNASMASLEGPAVHYKSQSLRSFAQAAATSRV